MRGGIHLITGVTGGGKTLLANKIARHFRRKGRTVYSNSKFSNQVKKIDIVKYFNNFKQQKELKNGILILDEIHDEFNKRLNKRNDYNGSFIPLIQFITQHRHEGITHVYLIMQSVDFSDNQLMAIVQKVHIVWSNLRASYRAWIRQKHMKPQLRPTWIKYTTRNRREIMKDDFEKYVNRKHEIRYKRPRINKLKITIEDLMDFDTFAFRGQHTKHLRKKKKGVNHGTNSSE